MRNNSIENYRLIKEFTKGFLDKRTGAYKSLKAAHSLCRESIEKKLCENLKLISFISNHPEQGRLIQHLIVNYALLKMHHHAILWEIEDHDQKIS